MGRAVENRCRSELSCYLSRPSRGPSPMGASFLPLLRRWHMLHSPLILLQQQSSQSDRSCEGARGWSTGVGAAPSAGCLDDIKKKHMEMEAKLCD